VQNLLNAEWQFLNYFTWILFSWCRLLPRLLGMSINLCFHVLHPYCIISHSTRLRRSIFYFRTDENGSWILASVQKFYSDTETYDVQDEDDTSKLIRLPWSHVMRLSLGDEGCFKKGMDCMAIFPETTSFYRAKVSKDPVWKLERNNVPMVKEIIVKVRSFLPSPLWYKWCLLTMRIY